MSRQSASIFHFRSRRANAAGSFIGLMLLFFVFYVLFLPPAERDSLLATNDSGSSPRILRNTTLMNIAVGHVAAQGPPFVEHLIPSMILSEATQAQVLSVIPSFAVKNSWFDTVDKTVTFSVQNLVLTENVLLAFKTPVRKGRLAVVLNGATLFDDAVANDNPQPIPLPKGLLKDANTITFKVSGVGIAFWSTNSYRFENAQVIADVTDLTRQQATATFGLDADEVYSTAKSSLSFTASCDAKKTGALHVRLNNKPVYDSVPDCDSINKQDIFTTDLIPGKNQLVFSVDKGSARLEQVKLRNEMKPVKSFLAFFPVIPLVFEEVRDGISRATLRIIFVDDGTQKQAVLNVNGRLDTIDQKQPVFSRDISVLLQPGNNYVEIVPRVDLNIVQVVVQLE